MRPQAAWSGLAQQAASARLRAEVCIAISMAYQKTRIDYHDTKIKNLPL